MNWRPEKPDSHRILWRGVLCLVVHYNPKAWPDSHRANWTPVLRCLHHEYRLDQEAAQRQTRLE